MEKKESLEEALRRLEEIVEKLGEETVTLDESLDLFSQGMKLSEACKKRLDEAELVIEEHLPRD